MKTAHKLILTLFAMALLAVCSAAVYAEEDQGAEGEGLRPNYKGVELSEEKIDEIMQGLTETDPEMAKRLEKLRDENPEAFQMQIKRFAMRRTRDRGRDGKMSPGMMPGQPGGRYPRRSTARTSRRGLSREMMQQKETEILAWLEKNDPNQAQELKNLKEENQRLYIKKMARTVRKYDKVIEAEKTNPALAAVLKEDIALKGQIRTLTKKIKTTTDNDEKQQLKTELESVVSQRFDLIVKKKQLQYEDLLKKLEELKNNIKESEAELENLKGKKSDHIKERVDELISKTERIRWE
jgi:hypothetical protein